MSFKFLDRFLRTRELRASLFSLCGLLPVVYAILVRVPGDFPYTLLPSVAAYYLFLAVCSVIVLELIVSLVADFGNWRRLSLDLAIIVYALIAYKLAFVDW